MVDVIFADVAQPDQARIVGLNAHSYLKVGGGVVVSIKANCIDSTAPAEQVFAREVQKLKEEKIKPFEQLTLEPYERGESFPYHVFSSSQRILDWGFCWRLEPPQIIALSLDIMFARPKINLDLNLTLFPLCFSVYLEKMLPVLNYGYTQIYMMSHWPPCFFHQFTCKEKPLNVAQAWSWGGFPSVFILRYYVIFVLHVVGGMG